MNKLHIQGSKYTPEIKYEEPLKKLSISGRSQPEDGLNYYTPLWKWLNELFESPGGELNLCINLDYFDTASAKVLYETLRKVRSAELKGWKINAEWLYEDYDEDMKEAGQQMSELSELSIQVVQKA